MEKKKYDPSKLQRTYNLPKLEDNPHYSAELGRMKRNYEAQPMLYNNLNMLVFNFAVYDTKTGIIYKINIIDYPGGRFECSGDRMSKWVRFEEGILFPFTDVEQFDYYYSLYAQRFIKPRIKDYILEWLKQSVNRIGITTLPDGKENDPVDTGVNVWKPFNPKMHK